MINDNRSEYDKKGFLFFNYDATTANFCTTAKWWMLLHVTFIINENYGLTAIQYLSINSDRLLLRQTKITNLLKRTKGYTNIISRGKIGENYTSAERQCVPLTTIQQPHIR